MPIGPRDRLDAVLTVGRWFALGQNPDQFAESMSVRLGPSFTGRGARPRSTALGGGEVREQVVGHDRRLLERHRVTGGLNRHQRPGHTDAGIPHRRRAPLPARRDGRPVGARDAAPAVPDTRRLNGIPECRTGKDERDAARCRTGIVDRNGSQ